MDDPFRVLQTSLFFEPFAGEDLEWLRTVAALVTIEADEVVFDLEDAVAPAEVVTRFT